MGEETVMLPSVVAALLGGDAAEDTWEPVFLLLTVGSDGYARVCQLSRAEVEVSPGRDRADVIRAVIRARRTIANLRRDGRGLLIVTGGQSAYYLRMRAVAVLEEDGGGTLAVAFAVDGIEERLEVHLRHGLARSPEAGLGGTLCLVCSDVDAAFVVEAGGGRLRWRRGRGPADAALVGTASQLFLFSWNRFPLEALSLTRRQEVVSAWAGLPA